MTPKTSSLNTEQKSLLSFLRGKCCYKFPCECPIGSKGLNGTEMLHSPNSVSYPLPCSTHHWYPPGLWVSTLFFLTDQLYKLWAAYCSKCLREWHLPRQQIYQNIPFFLAPMAISQTWFHVLFCVAHCWCCYICYTCVTSPKSYCTCYQHRNFKMYICLIMSLSDLKSFLLAYYSWN